MTQDNTAHDDTTDDDFENVTDSEDLIFDFFDHHVTEPPGRPVNLSGAWAPRHEPPKLDPDDEHLDNVRRVGRALAMIEHSRLWERAGFASIVAYVESLGVDATVVAMVRRLFPSPTPLARSTSEILAAPKSGT